MMLSSSCFQTFWFFIESYGFFLFLFIILFLFSFLLSSSSSSSSPSSSSWYYSSYYYSSWSCCCGAVMWLLSYNHCTWLFFSVCCGGAGSGDSGCLCLLFVFFWLPFVCNKTLLILPFTQPFPHLCSVCLTFHLFWEWLKTRNLTNSWSQLPDPHSRCQALFTKLVSRAY